MLSCNGSFSEVSRLFRKDLITVVFRDCGKKNLRAEKEMTICFDAFRRKISDVAQNLIAGWDQIVSC